MSITDLMQCSGRPGPCSACQKANYKCRFNIKHDSGNKRPIPSPPQHGELYLLNGVLQALKYGPQEPLMHFIQTLRENRPPHELVDSLRPNLEHLQDQGFIAKAQLREVDLLLLAQKSYANQLGWDVQPLSTSSTTRLPMQSSNLTEGRPPPPDYVLPLAPTPNNAFGSPQEVHGNYSSLNWSGESVGTRSVSTVSSISPYQQEWCTQGSYPHDRSLQQPRDAIFSEPAVFPEHAAFISNVKHESMENRRYWHFPAGSQHWHHTPAWQEQELSSRYTGDTGPTATSHVWLPPARHQPGQQHHCQNNVDVRQIAHQHYIPVLSSQSR